MRAVFPGGYGVVVATGAGVGYSSGRFVDVTTLALDEGMTAIQGEPCLSVVEG